jgi:gamma-glutamyl:cysteine ligase YbdK (ATP-grasp superfamily)
VGDHAAGNGFFQPIKSAVAAYIARHGSQVDTMWLRADLEEVIRRAPRDQVKHPDDYIEVRVDDLDPLISAIVGMEAASEAAEEAEAQRPPSDDDEPDELALLIEQNLEHFEALVEMYGGRVVR